MAEGAVAQAPEGGDESLDEVRRAAADLLWRTWQEGQRLVALPDDLRPKTRAEGYAIQSRLERRSRWPLFGWKIAATSAAGQAHIGVDGPLAGRLLAERALPDGAALRLGANHMRVVEPEFAFRMGRSLAPRMEPYTVEDVLQAVETLHPALEVPDSRYEDFASVGAPQLIADDACAHQFVLGAAVRTAWRARDLAAHPVSAAVAGGIERDGSGANVLGDPRIALAWLANELSGLGIPLKAGQVVTTGTCMAPLEVQPGDAVAADYGPFGRVSLRFSEE